LNSSTKSQENVLQERVITPHSGLDAFRTAIGSLRRDFPHARQLAWRFFLRDTRADHRQSLLGYFWLVLPPIASSLVWILLNNQKVVSINSGGVSYPLFVLSGTILWAGFNGGLMAMLSIVHGARGLLAKVNFPHEALVYSAVMKAASDTCIAGVVLLPCLFLFPVTWRPEMAGYPLALAVCLLAGCTIGLIVVPIAALYGDVSRGIQFVLRFGFFLTPVIFKLPEAGFARRLMLLNPATPLIVTGRSWLTGSNEAMTSAFIGVALSSLLIFWISLLFYKIALPHLAERLGT
jgi:lipopolysaccharide transport system permease protein